MLEDSKKLLFEPDSPHEINDNNHIHREEQRGGYDSNSKQINLIDDTENTGFNLNFKKNSSLNRNLSKNQLDNTNKLSVIDSVNASLVNVNSK